MINDKQHEILLITQEECAEVIQAISKIFRFGSEGKYQSIQSNREHLEEEVGDLLCMVDLLVKNGVLKPEPIQLAFEAKKKKLRKWSKLID